MDKFSEFLNCNFAKNSTARRSRKYKPGTSCWDLLDGLDEGAFDKLSYARVLYVKNLVLSDPVEFCVPKELNASERALMYCSFGAYDKALSILETPVSSEIIGAEAVRHSGACSAVLVAKLENTVVKESYEYYHDELTFPEYRVSPLTRNELLHLYIKIRKLEASTDNYEINRSHIRAYVNRALFDKNELNEAFEKAFLISKAEITNETCKLDKLLDIHTNISGEMFSSPITFTYQIKVQLARSLMANYDYNSAYDVLSGLPLYEEKIECLIAMKKLELAVREILEHINFIGNADERSDQVLLCNLHIKLGHIYQDPKYFDVAASFFHSAKPYQLKGLFHFNTKQFAEAAAAFKKALEITPNSEEIRFSYACSLVELNRIAEALKIFRLLKAENPQNENISKNLSFCFYKLKDIDNSLSTLKSVALNNPPAMKQLLYISIQNDRAEYIEWALQRICFDASITEAVNYLVQTGKFTILKLREILEKNVYLDLEQIESIFGGIR